MIVLLGYVSSTSNCLSKLTPRGGQRTQSLTTSSRARRPLSTMSKPWPRPRSPYMHNVDSTTRNTKGSGSRVWLWRSAQISRLGSETLLQVKHTFSTPSSFV